MSRSPADATAVEADLEVLDAHGEVVLEVSGLRMGSGASKSSERERLLAERLLTVEWEQRRAADRAAAAPGCGC